MASSNELKNYQKSLLCDIMKKRILLSLIGKSLRQSNWAKTPKNSNETIYRKPNWLTPKRLPYKQLAHQRERQVASLSERASPSGSWRTLHGVVERSEIGKKTTFNLLLPLSFRGAE